MFGGTHVTGKRASLVTGAGNSSSLFCLRTRELYYIFNNSKLKILFKVAP